jgi:hypothetical protein
MKFREFGYIAEVSQLRDGKFQVRASMPPHAEAGPQSPEQGCCCFFNANGDFEPCDYHLGINA